LGLKIGRTTLYLLTEAAAQFGVSRNALWRAIRNGKLKGFRVGKNTLVRPEDVAKWKERHYRAEMARRIKARWEKARKSKPTKTHKKP